MVGVGGGGNLAGVAITPNGSDVYVAASGSNFVSVIDTSTNTAVKRVTVGHAPLWLAITPNGSDVYVTNYGAPYGPSSVSVIKSTTNTVVKTMTEFDEPYGVAIT